MSITSDDFVPRPGIVNKKGCLPDPLELECIEVPKVFDQCLIKRFLAFNAESDTDETDKGLRSSAAINNPQMFLGARDFVLGINSIKKIPLSSNPSYKEIVIDFTVSFSADYIDGGGKTQTQTYKINRTEVVPKLYCPDSIIQTSSIARPFSARQGDEGTIKVGMVAECLGGTFNKSDSGSPQNNGLIAQTGDAFLDISLGLHLIVKSELTVQLLVPAYGYCPVPTEAEEEKKEDPREKFEKAPAPKFFPDQMLEPLFEEDDA